MAENNIPPFTQRALGSGSNAAAVRRMSRLYTKEDFVETVQYFATQYTEGTVEAILLRPDTLIRFLPATA